MKTFSFKSPGTETLSGTAYFSVEAKTEKEARAKLAEDASEYFTEFNDDTGESSWDADKPEDFELL
jgi:DNA-dependent RNA polymerase auxiliary subunit epsilon